MGVVGAGFVIRQLKRGVLELACSLATCSPEHDPRGVVAECTTLEYRQNDRGASASVSATSLGAGRR
jgi:hypothetical protein